MEAVGDQTEIAKRNKQPLTFGLQAAVAAKRAKEEEEGADR